MSSSSFLILTNVIILITILTNVIIVISVISENHLVKLVPPTPNVIHQNLVRGEFKFNRCPAHNDDDDDDRHEDDDDDDYFDDNGDYRGDEDQNLARSKFKCRC